MSHLPPEIKARRHRVSWCRKGRHNYGEPQHIGGGIERQVCLTCGTVSIDLTEADPPTLQLPGRGRRAKRSDSDR